MTPVEFRRELRAATVRHFDEYRRDITLAWHQANLSAAAMAGKLPSLARLHTQIDRLSKPQQKTVTMGELSALSEHLGVALRPLSPEAKAALERLHARG